MPVIGGNADGLRGEKDATCRLALRMKTAWAANLLPNHVGVLCQEHASCVSGD